MDGSSLNLKDDLDPINLGEYEATDFGMRVLDSKSNSSVAHLGRASVSAGIKRSISNAVERNMNTSAMDIFEVSIVLNLPRRVFSFGLWKASVYRVKSFYGFRAIINSIYFFLIREAYSND